MKTSNKIVLFIFLAPVLMVVLINAALYAKYKNGSYTLMKNVIEDRYTRVPISNVSHIAVYGLNNFRIIPADTAKLEMEKEGVSRLHYTVHADSLIIHGDSVARREGNKDDIIRSYQTVTLYLPAQDAVIAADNSEVWIAGTKDSTRARSYSFALAASSSLRVEGNESDNRTGIYFKNLSIHATHAGGVELTDSVTVGSLNLNMHDCYFNDNGATIWKLTIDADKNASLTFKGDNLRRLTTPQ